MRELKYAVFDKQGQLIGVLCNFGDAVTLMENIEGSHLETIDKSFLNELLENT